VRTNGSGIARRRIAAIAILIVTCAALTLLAGCASTRSGAANTTIRVMTWNIHHGEGTDGVIDVDRIAKLIVKEKIDVVALQELDRGIPRSKKIDIITTLADKTDLTYAFGKTIDYQGGEYGNGFLTRFPILEERNIMFTETFGREQRGVLLLILDNRGQEFVVANTHLDSRNDDSARVTAVHELKQILARYSSRPVLLCGDMNDHPSSGTVAELAGTVSDTWAAVGKGNGFTYPSKTPEKRIDYVFSLSNKTTDSLSTPLQLRPVRARVIESPASDHLPLIVEFTLTSEH